MQELDVLEEYQRMQATKSVAIPENKLPVKKTVSGIHNETEITLTGNSDSNRSLPQR
jgi:hypothetical protein